MFGLILRMAIEIDEDILEIYNNLKKSRGRIINHTFRDMRRNKIAPYIDYLNMKVIR